MMERNLKTALRKELQRAEEELARLEIVVSYFRERLEESDEPAASTTRDLVRVDLTNTTDRSILIKTKAKRITAAEASFQALKDRDRPTRTPDLLIDVRERGAQMKSSDNLFRTLAGNPRFTKVGRGLWALSEWVEANPDLFLSENGAPSR